MQLCRMSVWACVVVLSVCLSCTEPPNNRARGQFVLTVADAGQGLCQIGSVGDRAIVWDCGLPASFDQWWSDCQALGSPQIAAIVISHADLDHYGGLSRLPATAPFSGVVVVSPCVDTVLIRDSSGAWHDAVSFRVMAQGDTLGGLPDVSVTCIWPLRETGLQVPVTASDLKNRYSLCFRLTHGATHALITSDIDTIAEQELSRTYGGELSAEILVVPHHGSASSADPVFFGYVAPQTTVISCAQPPNEYGHPSQRMVDLIFQMGTQPRMTYDEGSVSLRSNGYCWTGTE